jgi:23S rRNA (uracil1939-C5)-methyltransferase
MMNTEITIEKLSHDGRGIARIDGKTTFIEGALPGEVISFVYTKRKKDFDEGMVTAIHVASQDRVDPKCPHFETCGGCSLQHIRAEAQIEIKQAQLLDLFQRVAHISPQEIINPLTASHWHYRHKARLSVRYVEKKGKLLIGFREKRNPRYLAEMQTCLILNERVSHLLAPLSAMIESLDAVRDIPQVEVAASEDDLGLIIRHMRPLSERDTVCLNDFARTHDVCIFLQPSGPDSVHLLYPPERSSFLTYHLSQYDLTFQFHPTDFTQIHPELNQKMVAQALGLLELSEQDRVLDLFCGLGNFSLPMAKYCGHVYGVEGSHAMVERAQMNARYNHIDNVSFQCANLEDEKSMNALAALNVNKALIDPPRAGALLFSKNIERFHLDRLVYISCDPATLARDTAILVEKGFELVASGVMDMFPHTTHVESIALFKSRKAKG